MNNPLLIIAGILSCIAAALHIAIIIGGPDWYRFFGAGEKMALLAEQGKIYPAVVTSIIAGVLTLWGLYAFSAANLIPKLPLLRVALIVITTIYLVRGLGGFLAYAFQDLGYIGELGPRFIFWSSLLCTVYGVVHLVGLLKVWPELSGH